MNWDDWRRNYDNWPYGQHLDFYDEVWKNCPSQRHVHKDEVVEFFRSVPERRGRVLEIGGWDGELATEMLRHFYDIPFWINFEVCRGAVAHSKTHPLFINVVAHDWIWNLPLGLFNATTVVAAHSLEHMRFANLQMLLKALPATKHWYVEMPMGEAPPNWWGYWGSHIIEAGWAEVDKLFAGEGFSIALRSEWIRFYDR